MQTTFPSIIPAPQPVQPLKVHNEPSVYGLSWFCSPRPALLWIGTSGRTYPHSFELWPLCTKPKPPGQPGVDFALATEASKVMKYFSLNRYYYKYELTTNWSNL